MSSQRLVSSQRPVSTISVNDLLSMFTVNVWSHVTDRCQVKVWCQRLVSMSWSEKQTNADIPPQRKQQKNCFFLGAIGELSSTISRVYERKFTSPVSSTLKLKQFLPLIDLMCDSHNERTHFVSHSIVSNSPRLAESRSLVTPQEPDAKGSGLVLFHLVNEKFPKQKKKIEKNSTPNPSVTKGSNLF